MKLMLTLAIALSSACLLGSCSTHESSSDDKTINLVKSPKDQREYQSFWLDNGLQVVLISDPTSEVAGASLSVGVGSYQNPETIPGLAHYLEHMLFLGTEKYPEANGFQTYVQQNAGFSNAYTATDHTNYFFQIGDGAIDEALDRFSDYFKSPTFDKAYSDKEKHAVDSEWSMGRTQDPRIINRLRGVTANPQHPAARMSVGNLETLEATDVDVYQAMLDFYDRYYSANNMKLVLFGKSSLPELQQRANTYFSSIANKNIELPEIREKGLSKNQMGQHIYYQPQKPMRELVIEFSIKDNSDQWQVKPNRFIANLLSSEEPGTAAQLLRAKGWVDNFTASVSPNYYGNDGIFTVNVSLTEAGVAYEDEIIATVFAYIEKIKQSGVDKTYYREYRAMLEKQFADLQVPQALNQAVQFSSAMFDLPVTNLINAYYVYSAFDPQAINSVLDQLRPQYARIWHIRDNDLADTDIPYYEGGYAVQPFTADELNNWQQIAERSELALPEENDLFSSGEAVIYDNTLTTPTLVSQSPGIEAWLAHSQYHQSEYGYVQVMFNSKLPVSSPENSVMSDLINRVFALKTTALRDKAGRAGIGMGIERPRNNHALTLSGYSEKHPLLYRRILTRWLELEIDQQMFAIALEGFSDWLAGREKDDPNRQAFTELSRLMSLHGWTDQQLKAAAESITAQDLQQYHGRLLRENRVRIYAFGNYNRSKVKALVETTEQLMPEDWQKRDRYLSQYKPVESDTEIAFEGKTQHTDNALLNAYYSPVDELNTGAELLLLNSVFNQAFYNKLRTEEQVGYIVGSNIDRIGNNWGFIVYAQTKNTPLKKLQQRFNGFIENYRSEIGALDESIFDTLRATVVAQINQPPGNFSEEYPRYLNDFYRGNDQFDTRQKLVNAIEATTKDKVVSIYDSLLLGSDAEKVKVQIHGEFFTQPQ
ncbi:insulinase family protein [Gilvimarinus sp. SDUM040013]|uniref:Protease 3 n=1 Tax=Gilvimarinus gilvus TaxID=3058038 RepID=A0ABU4RW72_9GAMM|nr:insulinase family protein [Gilvimarinus sp. SDUM040013]MDO3387660.1 insulinase family protein [Gilvimarinus sp. SDUM040013]MDX6848899.1 insulinase family protein [Gilvimarinus sp. SDUM040013]